MLRRLLEQAMPCCFHLTSLISLHLASVLTWLSTHDGLLADVRTLDIPFIVKVKYSNLSMSQIKLILIYAWPGTAKQFTIQTSWKKNNNKWVAQFTLCLSIINPTPHCSAPILMRKSYGQDSRLGSERVASVITECNIYVWPARLQGFDWLPGQPMNRRERKERRSINTSNEEAAVRG